MLFTYAQNTGWSNQLDLCICNCPLDIPVAISLEVAQITYMTLFVVRGAMGFGERVDCRGWYRPLLAFFLSLHPPRPLPCACIYKEEGGGFRRRRRERKKHTMRTSTSAAICIIPELMNMHPSLSRRVIPLDLIRDNRGRLLGSLFEMHRSAHGRVAAENCYCR